MLESFNLSHIGHPLTTATDPHVTGNNRTHSDSQGLNLALLHNLVHPEEELQDEISDGEILQAVVSSLAQWNLQKMRKKDQRFVGIPSKH